MRSNRFKPSGLGLRLVPLGAIFKIASAWRDRARLMEHRGSTVSISVVSRNIPLSGVSIPHSLSLSLSFRRCLVSFLTLEVTKLIRFTIISVRTTERFLSRDSTLLPFLSLDPFDRFVDNNLRALTTPLDPIRGGKVFF